MNNKLLNYSTTLGVLLALLSIFSLSVAGSESTTTSTDYISSKCNNSEGCYVDPVECNKECGCDGIYKYDETKGECVIDYEYLKERTRSNNILQSGNDDVEEDGMAKKIRENTEKVFRGIIFCAIFFIVCASICVISVCVFCCRIHYSDQKLKNEVKALAIKLNVDYRKRQSMRKQPRNPKEESCNVIVEDANVLCV